MKKKANIRIQKLYSNIGMECEYSNIRIFVDILNLNILASSQGSYHQGSKCPSLPGLTHWVNPGLPGLGFKPYFGNVGNTGE